MLTTQEQEQIINLILFQMFTEFEKENKNKFVTTDRLKTEFVEYEVKNLVYNFSCELNSKETKPQKKEKGQWRKESLARKWLLTVIINRMLDKFIEKAYPLITEKSDHLTLKEWFEKEWFEKEWFEKEWLTLEIDIILREIDWKTKFTEALSQKQQMQAK